MPLKISSFEAFVRKDTAVSARLNWDPPPPLPLASVSLPPEPKKGHTHLRVRGWGVLIRTTGETVSSFLETNRAYVFLFSVVFTLPPPANTALFCSYLPSLYSRITLYCGCGLAYPYDWRGFVGLRCQLYLWVTFGWKK